MITSTQIVTWPERVHLVLLPFLITQEKGDIE